MLKEIPREIYPKTFRGEVVWKLPFLKEYGCDIFTIDIQPKRYEYTFGNIKLRTFRQ